MRRTNFASGAGDPNSFELEMKLWDWVEQLLRNFEAIKEAETIEELFKK